MQPVNGVGGGAIQSLTPAFISGTPMSLLSLCESLAQFHSEIEHHLYSTWIGRTRALKRRWAECLVRCKWLCKDSVLNLEDGNG